jgi:NAD(P)H dehydrogenase (quinone)
MLVVTGATGQLGSLIVDRLLDRVPASSVGVSVRDVDRAAPLAARGVRVRAGDFTDPASLRHAFEGATQVLVVSAAIRGDGASAANRAAIDAARVVGAGRILYTSHQAASPGSLFPPQTVHAATEAHLARAGVPFVALRNGFYANALSIHLAAALQTGQIVVPEDGPVSWTAHDDLAEVAAIAMSDEGVLDGVTPALTAPVALDLGQVAQILSDLTGREITRVTVSDDAWRTAAVERGLPPMVADFSLGMFRAARRGEFAVTDPTLERILGRPATTVQTVLHRLLDAA